MGLQKKKRYVKISVGLTIILFLILFFGGYQIKAVSLLFISGGVLGIITKTAPFGRPSRNPYMRDGLDYRSIIDPIMNVLFVIIGLMCFFI